MVLVGGNLSSAAQVSVTVTVLGEAGSRLLRRDAARPGQDLYVTGTLGDAAAGVALLEAGKRRGKLVAAYRKPPLRCEAACLLNDSGLVRAMIDLSDGLLQDLRHVCRASEVSAMIDRSLLPLSRSLRRWGGREALGYALGGGDDYELLFSARAGSEDTLREALAPLSCEVHRIGKILRYDAQAGIIDERGEVLEFDQEGYRHFERRG